jgi:Na+/phosphate symporter
MTKSRNDWKEGHPISLAELRRWAWQIAVGSYKRGYHSHKIQPTEMMNGWLEKINKLKYYIEKYEIQVPMENLNAAKDALVNAILDFRKNGGILQPATINRGADLKSAEHLQQFHQMMMRNIKAVVNGEQTYGKQLAEFGKYWDAFMEDIKQYENL